MEPQAKLPSRQYEIDLFRFLAALAVVLYHYTHRAYGADNLSPVAYPELSPVTRYGYLGVQLFFIISGYVVLLSAQGKTVRQFFVSRVQRLYPAFWIACTLTFLIVRFWGTGPLDELSAPILNVGTRQYLQNLTMLQEFWGQVNVDQAYWSLTVEISFYFFISLLISYKLMPHINLAIGLLLAYAVVAPYLNMGNTPFTTLFFPQHAAYFVAGMLFYLMQQPAGRTWVRYAFMLVAYLLAVRYGRYGMAEHGVQEAVVLGIVTSFFILVGLVAFGILNFGRQEWLAKLGAVTYPLYLLHGHIGYVVFHRFSHLVDRYVLLVGLLVVMLLAAYLISNSVEKPLGKLLGRQLNRLLNYLEDSGKPTVNEWSSDQAREQASRPNSRLAPADEKQEEQRAVAR
ncbi:acyltransferase family protein [Hymenobacter arizonensis]|uniref:Peptidoglycan/LPS O-acetylase OafA/YrhL, contains acyltransferase and SGNH-hydrolase domains n=1 Tax=Hymenobacter arizonensis TaxID=1227077 RepID=A0A1I5ZBY8_HYMAR|nr:acyltransferase [Hymenobacter arizonensis]SFQ53961.1 Peptidoglycan/LPS O-acetylase OafA/YrhL, contains acyltransferase and SGNH-hydrolase domains [Hymenobacter arizonensis]